MSILPSQTQGSTSYSSSSALSSSPNSTYGDLHQPQSLHSQSPPSPFSPQIHQFGSLRISGPQSPMAIPRHDSSPLAHASEDSGGSPEEVIEVGTPYGMEPLPHEMKETDSQSHSSGRRVRSGRSRGKTSGDAMPGCNQQNTGSGNSYVQSNGRKGQMVNGNHLLNFHYDPISRPQLRGPPPPPARRQPKKKPYNKDLFLQANYKFVVLDSGNISAKSMDPDKMLRWEAIICVRYATPFQVQCPICLESPLCPQITSCGHIFCFPCILQYLLMGKEDHKGDCWKRCPLCFVMISQNDLYTIYIENVMQYSVGDTIDFILLSRQKDSFVLSHKNTEDTYSTSLDAGIVDLFSKFTFTSDVDMSVRKAISDLDGWLARAESGLVDDLEKLPYVSAAMLLLKQRKKYWNELRAVDKDKSSKHIGSVTGYHLPFTFDPTGTDGACCSEPKTSDFSQQNKGSLGISSDRSDQNLDTGELLAGQDSNYSSSFDENKNSPKSLNCSNGGKENDAYNFYQAADGQYLILHPLDMKCLLYYYGSYDLLPCRISGRILQLETITQSEAIRRRYRFLSHFSLTTTFQLCEIDMSKMLPHDALAPFLDEIKKREKQRKQLAKKERRDKIKAEVAVSYSLCTPSSYLSSFQYHSPQFTMDDFEALGSAPVTASPPAVGEKNSFLNVTRLGFAAGHDSPSLQIQETSSLPDNTRANSPGVTGSGNAETPSFANVTSRAKSVQVLEGPKMNGLGKKGKKQSRVLLSTTSGRRY